MKKLSVKGLKSLRNFELDLENSVVILEGKVGSGKTSVLDALILGLTGKHPEYFRGRTSDLWRVMSAPVMEISVTLDDDSVVQRTFKLSGQSVKQEVTIDGKAMTQSDADALIESKIGKAFDSMNISSFIELSPKEKLAELFKKFSAKSSLSVEKAKKGLINYYLVFSPEFAQMCRSAGKTIDELSEEEYNSFVEKTRQIKEINGTLHEYGVIEDFVSSIKGNDLRAFVDDVEDSLKTTLTARNKGVSDKKAELKILQEQRLEEVPVTVISGYKLELEGYTAKKVLLEEEKRKKLEFEKEESLLASAKKAFEAIVVPQEPTEVQVAPVSAEDLAWAHKIINSYGAYQQNEGAKSAVKEFDEDIAKKESSMSGRSQNILNEVADLKDYIDFWSKVKRNISEMHVRCTHCGTPKDDIKFSEKDLVEAKERLASLEKKAEAFKVLTRMKEQRERIAKTIVEMDVITDEDLARANDLVAMCNIYTDSIRIYNQKKATRDALLAQQKSRRDEYNSLAKKGRTCYSQARIDEEASVSEHRDMLLQKIAVAERASENLMKIKHVQNILNDREKEVSILKEFQKVIPPFKVNVLNSVLNEFKAHARAVLGKDIVITDDAFGYQVGDTLIDIKAMSGGERLIFTCSVIAAMINAGNAERLLLLEANELDVETTKNLVVSLSSSGLFDHAFVTSHYAVDIDGVQEVWMEGK